MLNKKIKTFALTAVMMAMMAIPAMAADTVTTSITGTTNQDVQVNPTITMALSTNSILFANADPTTASYEQAKALKITVQSNNTYKITAKAADDFKTTDTTPLVMTVNHLNLKDSATGSYQAMSKDAPIVLVQNQPNTAGTSYDIDFKLNSDWQVKPGQYKTTLNFVATQL